MKNMSLATFLFLALTLSQAVYGKCIFNQRVGLSERLKVQLKSISNTDESITFIAELPLVDETPDSLLPNPDDYDLNSPEDAVRFRRDVRIAKIEYVQAYYTPFLNEFREIEGLIVPDREVWTVNYIVLKDNV